MVTESDFQRATQNVTQKATYSVTQKATTHPAAAIRREPQETKKAHENKGFLRKTASGRSLLRATQVAGTGFEPATSRL